MQKKLFVFILLTAALLSACGGLAWETFTSPDGSFTVDMPGTAVEEIQAIPTDVGSIDTYFYTVDNVTEAYIVSYSDFPEDIVALTDADTLLQGTKEGVVGTSTIISEKDVTVQGYPALELVLESPEDGFSFRVLLIVQNNRLFQVLMVVDIADVNNSDYDPFFDSFTLNE